MLCSPASPPNEDMRYFNTSFSFSPHSNPPRENIRTTSPIWNSRHTIHARRRVRKKHRQASWQSKMAPRQHLPFPLIPIDPRPLQNRHGGHLRPQPLEWDPLMGGGRGVRRRLVRPGRLQVLGIGEGPPRGGEWAFRLLAQYRAKMLVSTREYSVQ